MDDVVLTLQASLILRPQLQVRLIGTGGEQVTGRVPLEYCDSMLRKRIKQLFLNHYIDVMVF